MWIIVVYFKWYRVNFLKEPVRLYAGRAQDWPKTKAKCTGETHSFTSRVQGCLLSVLWELFPLAPRPPVLSGITETRAPHCRHTFWRMFTYMCPILRIPAAPSCHLARSCLGAAASDSWRCRPGSVCTGVQDACRYTASDLPSVCLSLGHLSDPQAEFLGWLLCLCNFFNLLLLLHFYYMKL